MVKHVVSDRDGIRVVWERASGAWETVGSSDHVLMEEWFCDWNSICIRAKWGDWMGKFSGRGLPSPAKPFLLKFLVPEETSGGSPAGVFVNLRLICT